MKKTAIAIIGGVLLLTALFTGWVATTDTSELDLFWINEATAVLKYSLIRQD